jgi:hypothetical protein
MKYIVKGSKRKITYNSILGRDDRPIVIKKHVIFDDFEIGTFDSDFIFEVGNALFLTPIQTINFNRDYVNIVELKMTMEGSIELFVDLYEDINDEENKKVIEQEYEEKYQNYAENKLILCPNLLKFLSTLNKDLTSEELIELYRSLKEMVKSDELAILKDNYIFLKEKI